MAYGRGLPDGERRGPGRHGGQPSGRAAGWNGRRQAPRRGWTASTSRGKSGAAITAITRLRLDVALYDPVPSRPLGTIGRPRTKDVWLPPLAATLAAKDTRWRRLPVSGWYEGGARVSEIASATAVWRHGGLPVRPIRSHAHPRSRGALRPQALLCTDLTRDPTQIVAWFASRPFDSCAAGASR